eukprot:jgi/Pico_ML_1/51852/g2676.t1
MPQRKGRVAEVMRLREWREELVTYHGMVAVVFDDDPVRQFELMGVLEEEMEESEREEREMMEWWSPHIDVSEQPGVSPRLVTTNYAVAFGSTARM